MQVPGSQRTEAKATKPVLLQAIRGMEFFLLLQADLPQQGLPPP